MSTARHDRAAGYAASFTSARSLFEADVLEGLEPFAANELHERYGQALTMLHTAPGVVRFTYAGPISDLLDLRSVIAVYLLRPFAVPRPKALLGHQHLTTLVDLIAQVRALWLPGAFTTLRLSAAGEDTAVMLRLKDTLAQQTGLLPSDEGDLLLRLRRADPDWELLVRLSPRPLATRVWRVCNLPGALNATAAYAMMRLTQPTPADVALNIACGSGTLLIERLALAPARSAIGCDTDLGALACARKNVAASGRLRSVRLHAWDATRLPLEDASVDMICSDLPFGQLVGSHHDNEKLYPQLLAEAARVARPGARMTLFTHEVRLLEWVAASFAEDWLLEERIRVRVGGMAPRIYLFRRSG